MSRYTQIECIMYVLTERSAGKTADRVGKNKAMHAGYYIGYTLACTE